VLYAGAVSSPYGQSQYQVRFEWGAVGAETVSEGVGAIVWVDQLPDSRDQAQSPDQAQSRDQAQSPAAIPAAVPPAVSARGATVVAGSVQHAAAIADWALARQAESGDRYCIAVIAAGEVRPDGSLRFAVEDLLAAGAVVDALAAVGIDYCSPEAAAASAAFSSLRSATGHLMSASATGQALGRPKVSLAAIDEVVVL
jgi:2-phosphosulfolactate phosphatase